MTPISKPEPKKSENSELDSALLSMQSAYENALVLEQESGRILDTLFPPSE
jgi:hypothetical protein